MENFFLTIDIIFILIGMIMGVYGCYRWAKATERIEEIHWMVWVLLFYQLMIK